MSAQSKCNVSSHQQPVSWAALCWLKCNMSAQPNYFVSTWHSWAFSAQLQSVSSAAVCWLRCSMSAHLQLVCSVVSSGATCCNLRPHLSSVSLSVFCPLICVLSDWLWIVSLVTICQFGCDVSAQLSCISSGAVCQRTSIASISSATTSQLSIQITLFAPNDNNCLNSMCYMHSQHNYTTLLNCLIEIIEMVATVRFTICLMYSSAQTPAPMGWDHLFVYIPQWQFFNLQGILASMMYVLGCETRSNYHAVRHVRTLSVIVLIWGKDDAHTAGKMRALEIWESILISTQSSPGLCVDFPPFLLFKGIMEPALNAFYLNPGPQFDWLTNIAINCFHTMPNPVTSNCCKVQRHAWLIYHNYNIVLLLCFQD